MFHASVTIDSYEWLDANRVRIRYTFHNKGSVKITSLKVNHGFVGGFNGTWNRADVIDVGRSASFASVYNITMPVTPIPTKYTLSIVAVNGSPDAVSYVDSDLSPTRAKGTEYYRGDLFGNEVEGNSKVVAMEVRDTVSAMLPSLMRVFFSSENVVEFVPKGPEDVKMSQQATDYCSHIFQNDNNGFLTTYAIFKDALVRKCGIAKFWWEDEEKVRIEEYTGLDDQTLEMLMQEPGAEVKIVVSYPDPAIDELQISTVDPMTGQPVMAPPAMIHDVQIKRITKDGRIRIMAVPPEELLLATA